MAQASLEKSIKKYPELGLSAMGEQFLYRCGQTRLVVDRKDASSYCFTYEYCKTLIKHDRYEAAKDIALSRDKYSQLPFDRLPFIALIMDTGHLIEVVENTPKLEILPEIKGRHVNFFYEEGHKHQHVRPIFVGKHLRNNCLCESDVKDKKYNKAMLRAVRTPLSSKLIMTYDAHIQCQQYIESFDLEKANTLSQKYSLDRDIKGEFKEWILPLATQYRDIYRYQSPQAADAFALFNGFEPVVRDNRLVSLKATTKKPVASRSVSSQSVRAEINQEKDTMAGNPFAAAGIPTLTYSVN